MTGSSTGQWVDIGSQIVEAFRQTGPGDWADIACVIAVSYVAITALVSTRAWRVAGGIAVLAAIYFVSGRYLPVLNWMMQEALVPGVVGLLILFQPELRTLLAQIGGLYTPRRGSTGAFCDVLVDACALLSSKRIGALIAIERAAPLSDIALSGARVDARLSVELLNAIFLPNGPLHDGGVVISGSRIAAAACHFPISRNPNLDVSVGMRHRAALGLAEVTDAVCLVVSEETGAMSLALAGRLQCRVPKETLRAYLAQQLGDTGATGLRRLWTD